MDPIDRIDISGDSTFALLLEAQRRGHEMFYYTPPNLALYGGRLLARGHTLTVEDKAGAHYKVSDPRTVDLSELDVVLLRQDPPFDMAYITTTHLLERIHPRTLVVNDPAHVRNAPEKVFVAAARPGRRRQNAGARLSLPVPGDRPHCKSRNRLRARPGHVAAVVRLRNCAPGGACVRFHAGLAR